MAAEYFEPEKNQKQHLNLSVQAYETVQSDMFAFGETSLSGFINRVFEHYQPRAQASVPLVLDRLEGELTRLFAEAGGDEATKRELLELLLGHEKERLEAQARGYEKGQAFKFWLNSRNYQDLRHVEDHDAGQYYEGHRGRYIKAVVEEYARLNYVERERVWYAPYVEEIERAVRGRYQLRITTGSGMEYSIYPYRILCDPLATANYLVGYSKRYGFKEDIERPCSFRISGLRKVRGERSRSAFLREERWKQLRGDIAARGVQFLWGPEDMMIEVKLTAEGRRKYQRQIHLRPRLVSQDGARYIFQCTEAQAEFYFFKFGADAEVLRPERLRARFGEMYREALGLYRSSI